MTKQQHIAIIGAGPGGLSLARLLQKGDDHQQYSVKVYERDINNSVRISGGSLDLHVDSGQIFIDKAGLREEYDAVARTEGGFYTLYTQDLDKVWEKSVPEHPELDRNDLRTLLVNSLLPDTVIWDRHMIKIEPHGRGYHMYFKGDDQPVYCDAIIGADGASSKVRAFISPSMAKPTYSGVTLIQGEMLDPVNQCPELLAKVNKGSLWGFGSRGRSLGLQQKGDGTLIYFASFKADDEEWFTKTYGIDTGDNESFRAALLSIYEDYDALFLDLIKKTDLFAIRRCHGLMYRSTLNERWIPKDTDDDRPAITLIGDSAHVIPSFAGMGVNNAMLDTIELSEELFKEHQDIRAAFTAYEKRMMDRCIPAAEFTAKMEDIFHCEDNIREITKVFNSFGNGVKFTDKWKHLAEN
ncbi:uncharacterized protein BX664DRAFT_342265 [Halteromyces radiatus]|uniref:uncharacterized protein n=1 Tax=Halteromyces radiatus TaxID=101107 RepID=UPI00221F37C1|nr:uncharacterized protein BX664DRAFT_342265 [Halteromyces radiatus]KAI8080070.1 hypothetical protein BX664DRAFT_342265 [Halteromyces radiatus]